MRELLPLLPKPSRYIGIEEGSVRKRPDDVRLRVGLVFPDMYEVGMSYLGQKILYNIVNSRPDWQAERVFTPCREAADVLRAHNSPLCSLESDTPLADLDILGFSVTHELCYSNILYVLDLAGIPLRASDRTGTQPDGRPWPLVTAGGGCTLAAEPLAPFMDIMTLGESEETLPETLEILQQAKAENAPRATLLDRLSRISGVYVPEFFLQQADGRVTPLYPHHQTITRRVVPDLNNAPYPVEQPVPFGAVHNRLTLEIARGCTRGCRFCQAGSIYRPARERSVERLREILDACLAGTGFDDVSYLSLSTGDFSALKQLFNETTERCAREQISVSLPSLRVGSIDDDIMGRMAGIRRTGATLAPEAGSQRLRNVINKGITEEEVLLHIRKLFEHGWQQIKLYFMIGLPTETDDDILAIADLCRKARDAAGPGIKRLQVTASISPFVPKPHTPFQWEPQAPLEEIRRRIGILLQAVRQEKRVKLRWHEPEMSLLEGVFSRGDRRLAAVLESAFRKGALFTDWIEEFSLQPWLEALAECGLSVEEFTGGRETDAPLPWDHLASGLSRDFFLRERKKALEEKTSSDCRYTVCHQCGVCDGKASPSGLEHPSSIAPDARYANILNKPQRDQQAHAASLDQYGRVIVRAQEAPVQASATSPGGKARPPSLPPDLAGKAAQIRVWYAKKGAASYLSQLELQHIFHRALRRSGIPPSFSQGFHPLPLVSFGRALPVGVASECEWLSIYLREERPLPECLESLNRVLPEGLRVTSVESLTLAKKSADAPCETFRVAVPEPRAGRAAFDAAWKRVEATRPLPWLRETKKGPRHLDVRDYLVSLTAEGDGTWLLVFDWAQGYASPLALCLRALEAVGLRTDPSGLLLTKVARHGA